MSVFIVYKST